MSEGKRIVSSCLLFSILATPLASRAEPPAFLTELNLVREAMLDEPAKGYYEGPFNKAFYGRFSTWLNQCTQQTVQTLADLDLIVGLDSQGQGVVAPGATPIGSDSMLRGARQEGAVPSAAVSNSSCPSQR